MSLFPERETNVESVSERGTVDISRNSPNPFHVLFHATVKQFHVSCPNSTQNSRYFLAKSTLIPRKIHGKKSRDMRDSTFVSVRDINITLTVLYMAPELLVKKEQATFFDRHVCFFYYANHQISLHGTYGLFFQIME